MQNDIINYNNLEQKITYFRIYDHLEDCSSPVQIRELINEVGIRIKVYRVCQLFINRIKVLMKNTEDRLLINMYNDTLDYLNDIDQISIIFHKDIEQCVDLLRESRTELLLELMDRDIGIKDMSIILGMTVSSLKHNIRSLTRKPKNRINITR